MKEKHIPLLHKIHFIRNVLQIFSSLLQRGILKIIKTGGIELEDWSWFLCQQQAEALFDCDSLTRIFVFWRKSGC